MFIWWNIYSIKKDQSNIQKGFDTTKDDNSQLHYYFARTKVPSKTIVQLIWGNKTPHLRPSEVLPWWWLNFNITNQVTSSNQQPPLNKNTSFEFASSMSNMQKLIIHSARISRPSSTTDLRYSKHFFIKQKISTLHFSITLTITTTQLINILFYSC